MKQHSFRLWHRKWATNNPGSGQNESFSQVLRIRKMPDVLCYMLIQLLQYNSKILL